MRDYKSIYVVGPVKRPDGSRPSTLSPDLRLHPASPEFRPLAPLDSRRLSFYSLSLSSQRYVSAACAASCGDPLQGQRFRAISGVVNPSAIAFMPPKQPDSPDRLLVAEQGGFAKGVHVPPCIQIFDLNVDDCNTDVHVSTVLLSGAEALIKPVAVCASNKHIIVADGSNNRVSVISYSEKGQFDFVRYLGTGKTGRGSADLLCVTALAICPEYTINRVAVVDTGTTKVKLFDENTGQLLMVFGSKGLGCGISPGLFLLPTAACTSHLHGLMAVVDSSAHCVKLFLVPPEESPNLNGEENASGSSPHMPVSPPPSIVRELGRLADTFDPRLVRPTSGDKLGEFSNPSGVCFDADGALIVADHDNCRLQVFFPDTFELRLSGVDIDRMTVDRLLQNGLLCVRPNSTQSPNTEVDDDACIRSKATSPANCYSIFVINALGLEMGSTWLSGDIKHASPSQPGSSTIMTSKTSLPTAPSHTDMANLPCVVLHTFDRSAEFQIELRLGPGKDGKPDRNQDHLVGSCVLSLGDAVTEIMKRIVSDQQPVSAKGSPSSSAPDSPRFAPSETKKIDLHGRLSSTVRLNGPNDANGDAASADAEGEDFGASDEAQENDPNEPQISEMGASCCFLHQEVVWQGQGPGMRPYPQGIFPPDDGQLIELAERPNAVASSQSESGNIAVVCGSMLYVI